MYFGQTLTGRAAAPGVFARMTGRAWIALLALPLLVAACADGYVQFPVAAQADRTLSEEVEIIVLDATNISDFTAPSRRPQPTSLPSGRGWTYIVGVGDVLSVIVFNQPELTLPAGPQRSAAEAGFQVSADGTIFYPFIGLVRAAGRPVEQIRADISEQMAFFIPDPQVEVRVAAHNSQAVVVAGQVGNPNRQALTAVPLTLLEAINAAGGFRDTADRTQVSVQRGQQSYTVDVEGFLSGGLLQNNPILRNGDVVHVPRRNAQEAFLLGELGRQQAIELALEPITLTQAITRAGGLRGERADARGVLVFRSYRDHMGTDRIRVFQLDTSQPAGLLLGTRFVLEPLDVVYVMRSPLQRWNDTISRLLPTVRAITTVDSLADRL